MERLGVVRAAFSSAAVVPNLTAARVLEIGCAGGGNLLPLAERYPGSRLCGVNLSRVHIDAAKANRDALGLRDVELYAADIAEWQPTGEYDFIICHGVFSWVPPLECITDVGVV